MSETRSLIDLIGAYRGPCAVCGADARHRDADAIAGRVRAGELAEVVAQDYGLSVTSVLLLAEEWKVR